MGRSQEILVSPFIVGGISGCLLIRYLHLLLLESFLIRPFRTPLLAEACDCGLGDKFLSAPFADSLNFDVATHVIRVNFVINRIMAYHDVP